jgi:serine protease inhibitor ecotin
MKTLDLNAYGVSEMNVAEMQQIIGGNFVLKVLAWAVGCFAWDTISNPSETMNAIKKGAAEACAVEI